MRRRCPRCPVLTFALAALLCIIYLLTPKGLKLAIENSFLRGVLPQSSQSPTELRQLQLPACLATWRDSRPIRHAPLLQSLQQFCRSSNKSKVAVGSRQRYSAFHQPHFAEYFFFYISVLIEMAHSSSDCRQIYFSVLEDIPEFWNDVLKGKQTWVTQFIEVMRRSLGDFLIADDDAYRLGIKIFDSGAENLREKTGVWFLHPSDGAWLTSHVLSIDICSHFHTPLTPTRAVILQRENYRSILNLPEIEREILTASPIPGSVAVSTVFFDAMSFKEQAGAMLTADLLISVHGAGLTNIVFMKPCSVVIEILPYGFVGPGKEQLLRLGGYFGALAIGLDLIFLKYMESKVNSILDKTARFPGNQKECSEIYPPISDDKEAAAADCMKTIFCRSCVKQANLYINRTTLRPLIKEGLRLRDQCRLTHPAFAG